MTSRSGVKTEAEACAGFGVLANVDNGEGLGDDGEGSHRWVGWSKANAESDVR